jgi:transposase-like protein
MKVLAAIGWRLGLSYRGIVLLYGVFQTRISRMTAWRDVQLRADRLRKRWYGKTTRVVGVDGAYVLGPTGTEPILVMVDMGTGEPLALGHIDEKDPQAVEDFLAPLVQEYGISVIVTDGLKSYKAVSKNLELEHQECQFHLRRWVNRSLKDYEKSLDEEYQAMVKEVYQIIDELPPEGDKRLLTLYSQLPKFDQWKSGKTMSPLQRFRLLLIRLSENWQRFCVFQWHEKVPWTNNLSEQCICKLKMRSRTVRGYKSIEGMLNGLMVAGSLVS